MSTLVIVESPKKARTISKILGSGYTVEACIGHIRDLPTKADELPERYRAEPWANTAINPDGYKPVYVVNDDKEELVTDLLKKARNADRIIFATDDDREGEAISWHLSEMMGVSNPQRVVFHEITEEAIQAAIKTPRPLDRDLVEAQETRRIIDRYVGWEVSPKLQRTFGKFGERSLSAGRVQSTALFIVVQRELARMAFKSAGYFSIKAQSKTDPAFTAAAQLILTDDAPEGKPLVKKSHFDRSGQLTADAVWLEKKEAQALADSLTEATVVKVEQKEARSKPQPPFTTTTLQKAASSRLGFSVETTTKLAQALYEQGFITYIRTDSPTLSNEAIQAARAVAVSQFGAGSVPEDAAGRQYATRNKSAQEAHEAIRPAGSSFKAPEDTGLEGKELELYTLVYQRTVASQMNDAVYSRTSVVLKAERAVLSATGRVLLDAGFTALLSEEDDGGGGKDDDAALPPLSEGQRIELTPLPLSSEKTSPPAQFTDASLVEMLEKLGLVRPSTTASTMQTLLDREYLATSTSGKKKYLNVTAKGMLKISYLHKNLPVLLGKEFTAEMEEGLNAIAGGKMNRVTYLDKFWKEELEPKIAAAPQHPAAVNLPHLEGVTLIFENGQAYIQTPQGRGAIPYTAFPADIKEKDLSDVLKGEWPKKKAPRKSKKKSE